MAEKYNTKFKTPCITVNVRQAVELTGVPIAILRKALRENKLSHYRFNRQTRVIRPAVLRAWVRQLNAAE